MNTHTDKTQADKSQSTADLWSQKQNGTESTFQFVDNRPSIVAQRKLQVVANNSPQVRQLIAIQEMVNHSPQGKQSAQLQKMGGNDPASQQKLRQKEENNTGLPDTLKSGMENLSGLSLDDVKVHYHSPQPAQLQAHAYAQGNQIHIAPGQERHLPHEVWHVVQQKKGRVQPTLQMPKQSGGPGLSGKVHVNDDDGLEREADVMGGKALSTPMQRKKESGQGLEEGKLRQGQLGSVAHVGGPETATHSANCGCPGCMPVQRVMAPSMAGAPTVIQLKCKHCGAKSHSSAKCPKNSPEESAPSGGGGRGLTQGGKSQGAALATLLSEIGDSRYSIYGTGSKSLIGGKKGKKSSLKDSSARIDRQGEGNVQFQVGDQSFAGVNFDQDADVEWVLAQLLLSFTTCKQIDLRGKKPPEPDSDDDGGDGGGGIGGGGGGGGLVLAQ